MIFDFLFNKPPVSKDFVELSIGKIFLYEVTNGIENDVRTKSIIANNMINNNLYLSEMEKALLPISKRKWRNLTRNDSNIVRKKVVEILKKHELIIEEKEENIEKFNQKDVEWFNQQKENALKKLNK